MKEGEQPQAAGHWQYKPENGASGAAVSAPAATKDEVVEWTASEFIAHHKGFKWYALLSVGAVVSAALVYLVTRDKIATGAIVVCGVVFGIVGARKPRVLAYRLDGKGLTIGPKFYPYANYKAFALIDEGPFASISFLPFHRFMPAISIYFPPEDEEHIIEVLSTHLPLQPGGSSVLNNFMRRIRF